MNPEQSIEELPNLIADAERRIAELKFSYDINKNRIEVNKAKLIIGLRFKKLTEQDKKAMLKVKFQEDEEELINLEYKIKLQEIEFNKLTNIFISARKQVNFRIA